MLVHSDSNVHLTFTFSRDEYEMLKHVADKWKRSIRSLVLRMFSDLNSWWIPKRTRWSIKCERVNMELLQKDHPDGKEILSINDLVVRSRMCKSYSTGKHKINRIGNRVLIYEQRETYRIEHGEELLVEAWTKLVYAAIHRENKEEFLENIKKYCKEHCHWLKKDYKLNYMLCFQRYGFKTSRNWMWEYF